MGAKPDRRHWSVIQHLSPRGQRRWPGSSDHLAVEMGDTRGRHRLGHSFRMRTGGQCSVPSPKPDTDTPSMLPRRERCIPERRDALVGSGAIWPSIGAGPSTKGCTRRQLNRNSPGQRVGGRDPGNHLGRHQGCGSARASPPGPRRRRAGPRRSFITWSASGLIGRSMPSAH